MGNNFAMNDQSLARSFSVRDEDRDDFFHSSGYAGAQNEGRIGAASRGMTVEERQELSENRKFVRGYDTDLLQDITDHITIELENAYLNKEE